MTTERRDVALPVEVRSDSDTGTRTIRGYAYVFNKLSADLGGFRERIEPGAGRSDMTGGDLVSTYNHNASAPLARTGAGLRTGVDDVGGWYEVDLPDTTAGRDVDELISRGIVRGSSFTFSVGDVEADQEWTRDGDGVLIRSLRDFRVFELGPVTNPAYPDTTVAMRSIPNALADNNIKGGTLTAPVTTTAEERARAEAALQAAADEGRSDLEAEILRRLDAIDARFDAEQAEARAVETRNAVLAALEEHNQTPAGATIDENKMLRSLAVGQSAEFRAVLGVTIDATNKQTGKIANRPTLYTQLLEMIGERSFVIASGARVIRTTSGEPIDFPRVKPTALRTKTAEGQPLPELYPTTDMVTLTVDKTGHVAHVSAELVDDEAVDLIGFLVADAAPNMADQMGVDFVTTLLDTTRGILPAMRTALTAAQVTKDTVVTDALIDQFYSVPTFYASRAQWMMGRRTIARLRKLKDDEGKYLLKSVSDGGALTLMDRPVTVDPAFADANDGKIAFVDLTGFTVRFAGPLRVARSTDVKFVEDLVSFKFTQRFGGALLDPTGAALLTLPGVASGGGS